MLGLYILIIFFLQKSQLDLPIHCLKSQIVGVWEFKLEISKNIQSIQENACSWKFPYSKTNAMQTKDTIFETHQTLKLILQDDFSVVEYENSNYKTWLSTNKWFNIYDEAFEIRFNDFSLFSFFDFNLYNENDVEFSETDCSKTLIGWYSFQNDKGCFRGEKIKQFYNINPKTKNKELPKLLAKIYQQKKSKSLSTSKQIVNAINKQNQWQGKIYENMQNKSLAQIYQDLFPNKKPYIKLDYGQVKSPSNIVQFAKSYYDLPKNFHWEDFLPEPVEQGSCGSCYLIATIQMLESRIKIHYKNDIRLSHAFVNDCNYYSQACDGGYAVEVLRFMKEYYTLPFSCKVSRNTVCEHYCSKDQLENIKLVKVKEYGLVSGEYNGASEQDIEWEIFKNGPIVMSFQSQIDLGFYQKGIYSPLNQKIDIQDLGFQKKKEWIGVNHSVLVYGWGEENGVKFWRAQNSWGKKWGENGRFKLIKGQNMLGIESMPEWGQPILIDMKISDYQIQEQKEIQKKSKEKLLKQFYNKQLVQSKECFYQIIVTISRLIIMNWRIINFFKQDLCKRFLICYFRQIVFFQTLLKFFFLFNEGLLINFRQTNHTIISIKNRIQPQSKNWRCISKTRGWSFKHFSIFENQYRRKCIDRINVQNFSVLKTVQFEKSHKFSLLIILI